jgi:hypothetical protein
MRRIRPHLTFANVASSIALFVALGGGTAVALNGSNTVFSDDIVDNAVRTADVRDDNLAGGGLAASDLRAGSVGGSEVAADSLGAVDLAPGSVGSAEVADDSLAGVDVLDGSLGPAELAAIPAARATNSSNQSIPASTPTTISLDTEGFDTTNLHDTATNDSRLTAPITGVYQINGRVRWASGTNGNRELRIEKDRGQPLGKTIAREIDTASATDDLIQDVSTISFLAAGDYVELSVTQQNLTATAVNTNADPHVAPELSMAWIGSN